MKNFCFKKIAAGKLLPAVFLALFLLLFYFADVGCVWQRLFQLPCPGCGMTRAWLSALRGEFRKAFYYNAMFWSVPLLVLFILKNGRLFLKKWVNIAVLSAIAAGFLANYIWHLSIGFR